MSTGCHHGTAVHFTAPEDLHLHFPSLKNLNSEADSKTAWENAQSNSKCIKQHNYSFLRQKPYKSTLTGKVKN